MNKGEVRLNDIIASANKQRQQRGLKSVSVSAFIRSTDFNEIVLAAEERLGLAISVNTKKQKAPQAPRDYTTSPLVRHVPGTGSACGVWVNSKVGICAAAHLDKQLAVNFIDLLTASPLWPSIDPEGDAYKTLTDVKSWLAENKESEGDISDKLQLLDYIIAMRCGVTNRPNVDIWSYATSDQLYARRDLQFAIATAIRNRFVSSFQQLLEYVANGSFPIEKLKGVNLKKILKRRNADN